MDRYSTAVDTAAPQWEQQDDAPPRRAGSWLARGSLLGLGVSVLAHVVVALVLGLVTVARTGGDAGGSEAPGIEFAVGAAETLLDTADEIVVPEAPSVQRADTTSPALDPLVDLTMTGSDAADALREVEIASTSGGASGPAQDDAALGSSSGSGNGASFFGLEAQGKRFAYVVDISSSMEEEAATGDSRIALTKRELSRSVSALIESGEFVVILYAGQSASLTGSNRWTPATEANKLSARRQIGLIDTSDQLMFGIGRDGTKPLSAFETLFNMRPRPDAIYFMTDGVFNETGGNVPEVVAKKNRHRIPVHCILFMAPDEPARQHVEPEMLRIARESGGRYRLFTAGGGP